MHDGQRFIPLIGLIGEFITMFLNNSLFSLIAIVTIFLLYQALLLRQLTAPWSDVRSGIFVTLAEWAAKHVLSMPSGQDRAWKPRLLLPVESTCALRRSYRFLTAIMQPNGSVHILGAHKTGERETVSGLPAFEQIFANDGIFARVALVEARTFGHTLQAAMNVHFRQPVIDSEDFSLYPLAKSNVICEQTPSNSICK